MCTMRQPKMPDPPAPPEIVPPTQMAAPQTPEAASRTAGTQQRNRIRSAAPTILTSGRGALDTAPTDKKTLLGA